MSQLKRNQRASSDDSKFDDIDFEDVPPRKRPKLNEAEGKKRFLHQRPESPAPGKPSEITSSTGTVVKAVRYGDSLIQYETAPIVLDSVLPGISSSSKSAQNTSEKPSMNEEDYSRDYEFAYDLQTEDGAGAPSGAAPRASGADEVTRQHEIEAELNVAGDFAPISIGSRTAAEVESHTHRNTAQTSETVPNNQEKMLEAFIPLEAPPRRQRANSRNPTSNPTTPEGKNPLPDKYHSVYANEVGSHLKLPPWAAQPYQKGHWCLSEEIKDFVKWIEPTPLERAMRRDLINRIQSVVVDVFPHSNPQVFGSYSTDLFLPLSDIDMVILGVDPMPQYMRRLASALTRAKICPYPQVIERAKVPIVKFIDSRTGIQVDISFNQENGIHNTVVVNRFLKEFDALRPLVMVLKYFMQSRDLQEPYTGGVGSYALTLMAVSFLQQQAHYENGKPETNLGYLLIDFFDFFGYAFNYYTTGISVRKGGSYFNKMNVDWYDYAQPFLLAIEDPNEETNDVGRPSYRVPFVRLAFQESFQRLTNHNGQAEYAPTILSRIVTPLQHTERARAHWKTAFAYLLTGDGQAASKYVPPHKRDTPPSSPRADKKDFKNSGPPRFKPYKNEDKDRRGRADWADRGRDRDGDRERDQPSYKGGKWRQRKQNRSDSPPRGNKKYGNDDYSNKRKRSDMS